MAPVPQSAPGVQQGRLSLPRARQTLYVARLDRRIKKNDQAWVEQKNGAIVRRLVGYGRLTGMTATSALARLYEVSRAVHQLLPALVQAEIEDARRRSSAEGLLRASDAV